MDPECRDIILQSSGISLVTNCLSSQREETVLSAITTLMNLITPSSHSEITNTAILQCMLRFSLSESPRLCNLAAVFLQDCCTKEQVDRAEQQMQGQQTAVGIPLPKDWGTTDPAVYFLRSVFAWEWINLKSLKTIWHWELQHEHFTLTHSHVAAAVAASTSLVSVTRFRSCCRDLLTRVSACFGMMGSRLALWFILGVFFHNKVRNPFLYGPNFAWVETRDTLICP